MSQPKTQSGVSSSAGSSNMEVIAREALEYYKSLNSEKDKVVPWWKRLANITTKYWFLASVLVYLFSCLVYGTSVLFPFKQMYIADQELDRKQRQYNYERELSEYFFALGERLMNVAKYKDAGDAYAQAVELDNTNSAARFGLHKAQLLDRSEYKEFDAEVIARRVDSILGAYPDDSHALSAKALLLTETGAAQEQAEALWGRALQLNPSLAEAQYGLGNLYWQQGKLTDAVTALKKAVELAPYRWEYRNNLASALARQNNTEEALQQLQKIFVLDPQALLPLLESARLSLFNGQLTYAQYLLNRLVLGLQNVQLQALSKNAGDWLFDTESYEVVLPSLIAKQEYSYRLLSLVNYLKRDRQQAAEDMQRVVGLGSSYSESVEVLFMADLQKLRISQPAALDQIDAFYADFMQ